MPDAADTSWRAYAVGRESIGYKISRSHRSGIHWIWWCSSPDGYRYSHLRTAERHWVGIGGPWPARQPSSMVLSAMLSAKPTPNSFSCVSNPAIARHSTRGGQLPWLKRRLPKFANSQFMSPDHLQLSSVIDTLSLSPSAVSRCRYYRPGKVHERRCDGHSRRVSCRFLFNFTQ